MAESKRPRIIRRFFRWLFSPSARLSVIALVLVGVAGGTVMALGIHVAMNFTDNDKFCGTTCHSHENFVYPVHKTSFHYSNRTSVRAKCVDCHVPRTYPAKLIKKVKAGVKNVIAEARGKISTQEKFDKELWRLANVVWEEMRATNSASCRSCHNNEEMDSTRQTELAQKSHKLQTEGKYTCIDCHSAMEHQRPLKPKAPAETPPATPASK
jgi:cytochrome c-type protein NapC